MFHALYAVLALVFVWGAIWGVITLLNRIQGPLASQRQYKTFAIGDAFCLPILAFCEAWVVGEHVDRLFTVRLSIVWTLLAIVLLLVGFLLGRRERIRDSGTPFGNRWAQKYHAFVIWPLLLPVLGTFLLPACILGSVIIKIGILVSLAAYAYTGWLDRHIL